MYSKNQLTKAVISRYHKAKKGEKGQILSEYCAYTGYNRKYAIWKLNRYTQGARGRPKQIKRPRPRIYGEEIKRPLKFLWELLGCICSARLKPILPELVNRLLALGELQVSQEVAQKLTRISRATIDRLLKEEKLRLKRRRFGSTKPGTLLKSQIPIRTGPWEEEKPGYGEIDLVSHGGESLRGEYANTLNFTDIATAWMERQATFGKAQEKVFYALRKIRERLPFPLLGIDSDNDGAFINDQLWRYCQKQGITFTRSRPYKKNDNAHVEQKNWTCVRQVLGYVRMDIAEAVVYMNQLYEGPLRLFTNFFLPVQKCIRKERVGARPKKYYDLAKTPYQRVLESPHIPIAIKIQLQNLYYILNPVSLRKEIDSILHKIDRIHPKEKLTPDLEKQPKKVYFLCAT